MNVKIIYFSGTGSTKYVAESFKNEIEARGHTAHLSRIREDYSRIEIEIDLLIICYAVHACNAPTPVIEWVNNNISPKEIPAAIISVSGGGEVTPNLACRQILKKKLNKNNYSVFHEKMIIMPSNWIVSTKPLLVDRLFEVLPSKISFCVNQILNFQKKLDKPGIGNRIISRLALLEHYGAPKFGKKIAVGSSCNGCGICLKRCPVGNINLLDSKPVFSNKCTMCLQCIYSCPQKALSPGVANFVVLQDGFDLPAMLKNRKTDIEFDLGKEARGFLWLGVRRYLENDTDIREPEYHA